MKILATFEIGEDQYSYHKTDEEKLMAVKQDLTQVDADVDLIQIPEGISLHRIEKMINERYEAVMNAKYDETFRELSKGSEEEAENDRD